MKKGLIFLLFCFAQLLNGQPVKQWTKLFGGNLTDVGNAIAAYNDTMLIAVGRSSSTNVGGNKGGDDYAICQFRPNGDLIRLKTFGGPQTDQANAMVTLPNGNLIVGGFTNGRGSDVTNLYGLTDIWLLGYDPRTGNKVWQKNYGGTNNDQCNDLFFLEAGKVFLAGHTKSLDRDVVNSPTKGGNDILITSVDESGNIVKVFTFGGTDDETAKRILKAEDFGGQMLVFGESESNDLDFAGLSRGKKDIFILKINRNINKVFLKTIGGPGDDIFADALYLGADGMIVFSTVNTPGGQVDSLKGGRDIWMSRLDKDAKLLWSRLIGGRLDETAVKAILTPANEILLIGNSNSKDQDIKANYGGSDALVMKLDTAGNILWQQNYGGTSGDNSGAICLDATGSIYFVGQSFSVNNDLPATNTVPPDFWTMKLFECHSTLSEFSRDACIGDTLTIGKQSYYSGKENGVDTFFNVTANGCDSIVQVQVHFHPATSGQILDTLCNDATMTINNVIFDKNNTTRTFSLTNHLGCDSTLQVDLSFLPEILVTDTLITKDDGTGSGCIKVTVEGGCEPYRYEWSNGAQTPEVCSLAKGTYTLTLKDCMDCSREFSFNVGTTVANEDLNAELPVISYAGDRIIVRTGSVNITRLSLYTVSGQLIRNQEPGIAELALLRSDLPNGSLLMDLVLENGRSFQFLVVN